MHVREIDGRSLRFGHRGWLWHSAFVLYDTETDSIWHHQTGWAMDGPLRGKALPRYPTQLMTWRAWKAEHPGTLVLPKPNPTDPAVRSDDYARRNAVISYGLGVDLPGAFRLYPYVELDAGPVEEYVDGVPLVVTLDRTAGGAFAWDRRVDGESLSFEVVAEPDARPQLRERDGERAWWLRSGRPVAGTGADGPLRAVFANQWEVAAWGFQHPTGSRYPDSTK